MRIPLKTQLFVECRTEDRYKGNYLAVLVEKKLLEEKYFNRLNALLNECAKECMSEPFVH